MQLSGAYFRKLQSGGWLQLPEAFLKTIGKNRVYLTRGLDGCLFLFPAEEWRMVEERFKTIPFTQGEGRRFNQFFFSGAVSQVPRASGRICIPRPLLEFARLSDNVLMLGVVNRLELWDHQGLSKIQDKLIEIAADLGVLTKGQIRVLRRVESIVKGFFSADTSATRTVKKRFFLCYSSRDRQFALKLAQDLVEEGVTVWIDHWQLQPGDSLYEKIPRGIRQASWFGIVLSPNSVASRWCRRELSQALEKELQLRGRPFVIPILHHTCRIPAFLEEKVYVDMRKVKYRDGLQVLLGRFQSEA